MPKKQTGKVSDWKGLRDGSAKGKSRAKPVSWRARLRSVWVWTKRIAAVAAVCALGYGAYYAYENIYFEEILGADSRPIRQIAFKTDGAIGGAWMNSYLKIRNGSKLTDVNIFSLKQAIDALTQIKSSEVERVFPDTLRITISEHKPMAKIIVRVDYEDRIFLMSDEGVFFRPICISDADIAKLLYISGIKTPFSGSAPATYPDAARLKEFIDFAKSENPEHFAVWYAVDVSEISSITLPLLTVTTKDGVAIVFEPKDYKKQFDRLQYILRYIKENPFNRVEKMDLTLKENSLVKFAPEKSK